MVGRTCFYSGFLVLTIPGFWWPHLPVTQGFLQGPPRVGPPFSYGKLGPNIGGPWSRNPWCHGTVLLNFVCSLNPSSATWSRAGVGSKLLNFLESCTALLVDVPIMFKSQWFTNICSLALRILGWDPIKVGSRFFRPSALSRGDRDRTRRRYHSPRREGRRRRRRWKIGALSKAVGLTLNRTSRSHQRDGIVFFDWIQILLLVNLLWTLL